jgi:hypothetical protein
MSVLYVLGEVFSLPLHLDLNAVGTTTAPGNNGVFEVNRARVVSTCSAGYVPARPATGTPSVSGFSTGGAPTPTSPEPHHLAGIVEAWWPQIEAFILIGITNATSEDVNRADQARDPQRPEFRNPVNQRLRSRCASMRTAWRRATPGQLRRPG